MDQTDGQKPGTITFHALSGIDPNELVALLNDPDVQRHMPLAGENWNVPAARDWAAGKDAQWQANGYGPWAIRIGGAFAGWGGFQKEGDEADLGLVLLPGYWGHGARIFRALLARGRTMNLDPITILLPPSRLRTFGLTRLGFRPAGEITYDGEIFRKFVLERPVGNSPHTSA